jgi:hypothetical protein
MSSPRRHARSVVTSAGLALLGLTLTLAGCAGWGGVACTAIGYTQSLTVVTVGQVAEAAFIEFCDAEGRCSLTAEQRAEDDTVGSVYDVVPVNGSTWRVTLFAGQVPEATVTAYREDGSTAGAITTPLAWTWLPDDQVCGGPTAAFPVFLPVG